VKFLALVLCVFAWTGNVQAKETPAADCKYLLMKPEAVRENLRAMTQTPAPESNSERKERAAELRAAANVLLGHSGFNDADVKKAFQVARELMSGQTRISNLYPLTVGAKSSAHLETKNLGPLSRRFSSLILRAFPIYRADNMEKPVAYVTKIVLDVGENDMELFSRLFNERAFLHESISATLKSHREDLIEIGAALLRQAPDQVQSPVRMRAVVITPVVTDAFAYTHAEFRRLNRDHQDFLSFFAEMKNSPDEIIYELLHMMGVATDHVQFEN
jgi:hypothetical protein